MILTQWSARKIHARSAEESIQKSAEVLNNVLGVAVRAGKAVRKPVAFRSTCRMLARDSTPVASNLQPASRQTIIPRQYGQATRFRNKLHIRIALQEAQHMSEIHRHCTHFCCANSSSTEVHTGEPKEQHASSLRRSNANLYVSKAYYVHALYSPWPPNSCKPILQDCVLTTFHKTGI